MDGSTVVGRTPTRIDLWKFQASKQLFSNWQPLRLSVIESLTEVEDERNSRS